MGFEEQIDEQALDRRGRVHLSEQLLMPHDGPLREQSLKACAGTRSARGGGPPRRSRGPTSRSRSRSARQSGTASAPTRGAGTAPTTSAWTRASRRGPSRSDRSYIDAQAPTVREQLVKTRIRLAGLLNQALGGVIRPAAHHASPLQDRAPVPLGCNGPRRTDQHAPGARSPRRLLAGCDRAPHFRGVRNRPHSGPKGGACPSWRPHGELNPGFRLERAAS